MLAEFAEYRISFFLLGEKIKEYKKKKKENSKGIFKRIAKLAFLKNT